MTTSFRPKCSTHELRMKPITMRQVHKTSYVPAWKCPSCNNWMLSDTASMACCVYEYLDYETAVNKAMPEASSVQQPRPSYVRDIRTYELYEF